jgi:hypothetical protein
MRRRGRALPLALLLLTSLGMALAQVVYFDSPTAAEHTFQAGKRVFAPGGERPLDSGEKQIVCGGPSSLCSGLLLPSIVRCVRDDDAGADWDCRPNVFWVDNAVELVCPAEQAEIDECHVVVTLHSFDAFVLSGSLLLLIVVIGAVAMYAAATMIPVPRLHQPKWPWKPLVSTPSSGDFSD